MKILKMKTLKSLKDLSKEFYKEKGIPEPKPFIKKKHFNKVKIQDKG